MNTKIRITITHNLEHYHKGWEVESLNRFLSNEEQYTYCIYVDDLDKDCTIAFSLGAVCPLGDNEKFGTPIYRTRQEVEAALLKEFNAHFAKYGSLQDAEITEEEYEFGKEVA